MFAAITFAILRSSITFFLLSVQLPLAICGALLSVLACIVEALRSPITPSASLQARSSTSSKLPLPERAIKLERATRDLSRTLPSRGAVAGSQVVGGRSARLHSELETYNEGEGWATEGARPSFTTRSTHPVDDQSTSHPSTLPPPSPSGSSTTYNCPSFDDGGSSSDYTSSDEDEDEQGPDDILLQSNASCLSLSLPSAFYQIAPSTFFLPSPPFSHDLRVASSSLLPLPSRETFSPTPSDWFSSSRTLSDRWADSDDYDPFAGPDTFPSSTTLHLVASTISSAAPLSQDWADEDDEAFLAELPVFSDTGSASTSLFLGEDELEEIELEEGELLEDSEEESEDDSEDEESPFAFSVPSIEEANDLDDERFVDLTSLRRPVLRNPKLGGSMREQRLRRAAIYSSLMWQGVLRGDEPWLRW